MILDSELFKEVVAAIGVDTCLVVIKMFQEQSPVLVAGACNTTIDVKDRAESLHALKGMAQQLGLNHLSQICCDAETAILSGTTTDTVIELLSEVERTLSSSQHALKQEAILLNIL